MLTQLRKGADCVGLATACVEGSGLSVFEGSSFLGLSVLEHDSLK